MNFREFLEKREKEILSPRSKLSSETKGRKVRENPDTLRTEFMRDRDRIIHSEAFRRLKHKTQVFLSPTSDTFRTRLTHTLEVSQIARTIARILRCNEDLTEAIALGHDVGHTPFGHTGEVVIREEAYPEFKHSEQSVRVLQILEKNRKGLNLTAEVLDGIRRHSKTGKAHIFPDSSRDNAQTLEGEIVRISDIIAYVNHDIDDAVRSGVLKESDLPEETRRVLGKKHSERIDTLVRDVVRTSENSGHIRMSPPVLKATEDLRDFLFDNVYRHPVIAGEMDRAKNILRELYRFLRKRPELVKRMLNLANYTSDEDEKRAVVDFLALMTDTEAMKLYSTYFLPKSYFWF